MHISPHYPHPGGKIDKKLQDCMQEFPLKGCTFQGMLKKVIINCYLLSGMLMMKIATAFKSTNQTMLKLAEELLTKK